jgi:hypothetical protein
MHRGRFTVLIKDKSSKRSKLTPIPVLGEAFLASIQADERVFVPRLVSTVM